MRINCIDCLDRTNNSMACISGIILADMLWKLNLNYLELFIDNRTLSVKN